MIGNNDDPMHDMMNEGASKHLANLVAEFTGGDTQVILFGNREIAQE
jgi:hypothetical protein